MASEEELRKRVEELEKGLAEAKWRADLDRQTAQQKEYARMMKKKENGYAYWALTLFVIPPFLYVLIK